MNVLYDLAITIGNEISLQPLLTRTLQQLMLHTDSSCSLVLLTDTPPTAGTPTSLLLAQAIGDTAAQAQIGSIIRLDGNRLQGDSRTCFDYDLLQQLPCHQEKYRRMLQLPIPDTGLILLLSPDGRPVDLPLETMFSPVMANLAKSIHLCHMNDAQREALEMKVQQRTEALRRSEKEFRAIFDNMQDTFYRADTAGRILLVSPSVTELIGCTPEEIAGRQMTDFYANPDERELFLEAMRKNSGKVRNYETRVRRTDGRMIWVSTSSRYFFDERGEVAGVEGIIRNITEYRELKEQLQQAQKMEAVGRLVGGIAHDFNNILAAIQGNVFLARMGMDEATDIRGELENIDKLSMRAAEMIRQLLAFSRKDTVKMQPLALNDFIRETFALTRSMIPENIEVAVELPGEELSVSGDQTQLQQAIINLLNNARDALDDVADARIVCRLDTCKADEMLLQRFPDLAADTPLAHLVISDNGHGIPEADLDKIFEPFYTTKEVDKGTGLGLSMVYGAIQTHNGAIRVESANEHGTTVHLYLPLMKDVVVPVKESVSDQVMKGRGETILLVDDDRDVRRSTSALLSTLGYNIIEAENGEEALAIYRDHMERIDLVVTDVIMPRMKGTAAVEAMRKLNSQLPAIFVTGYDEGQVMQAETPAANSSLLTKPFHFSELSRLIQQQLYQRDHPQPQPGHLQKSSGSA